MDKSYEQKIEVEQVHIDALGHVNNLVYLHWAQDVAGAHWQQNSSLEEQQKYRWVVLRHEIDYLRPAFVEEKLTARTWVANLEGVKSFRQVEIYRGDTLLAQALTTWVMINPDTGKPARIPEEMARKFLPD